MAQIIGGIGTSHVPTIAMAFDKGRQNDPDWQPLFRGYEPVATWLAEKKPDVLFFCFNDHATTFIFDHYPTFALGVSDEYRIADEGLGERAGYNNEQWDREFLELIERDPERLASMTIEDFMRLGGNEGAEVIMWLIMRGALGERAKKLHDNYYLPMTTAMAVALFE